MQFEITDQAAIRLSQTFYESLADGYPAEAALAEARKAIYTSGNDVEWGTPVLYLRAPDGQLFDWGTTTAQPNEVSINSGSAETGRDKLVSDTARVSSSPGVTDHQAKQLKQSGRPWLEWVAQKRPLLAELIECAAQLCESLAEDHARGIWHQTWQPIDVVIDAKGHPMIQGDVQKSGNIDITAERLVDLHSVGLLLFEALTENMLPSDASDRASTIDRFENLPPSLKHFLHHAVSDPPDWPTYDPQVWAAYLRTTQTGRVLVDRLAQQSSLPADQAIALAIAIGETLTTWQEEHRPHVPLTAELTLLDEGYHGTPSA
jgi:hypothetical protein